MSDALLKLPEATLITSRTTRNSAGKSLRYDYHSKLERLQGVSNSGNERRAILKTSQYLTYYLQLIPYTSMVVRRVRRFRLSIH